MPTGRPVGPENLPAVGSLLSWQEVWPIHRSWRGIGTHSLLIDRGESGYSNLFLPDGSIEYPGEGRQDHQKATGGNLRLLKAVQEKQTFHLFCRIRPGQWRYEGTWWVVAWAYLWQPGEQRWQYRFTLTRAGVTVQ